MKLLSLLTSVATLIANSALAAAPSRWHLEARKTSCPHTPSDAIPFFRADKPGIDHVYSTDSRYINEIVTLDSFKANGTAGNIFPSQLPGTIPLYLVYSSRLTDHLYTTSSRERTTMLASSSNQGYRSLGVSGYVLPDGACVYPGYKVLPLYRLISDRAGHARHLLTQDEDEKAQALKSGYYKENGVAGYVITGQRKGCVPCAKLE